MTLAVSKSSTGQTRQRLTTAQASRRLNELHSADLDADQVVSEIVEIAAGLTNALGVIFLARESEGDGRLAISPEHYSPPHLSHLRSLLQYVLRLATVACAEDSPQAGSPESDEEMIVVTVPVIGGIFGNEAIAAAISVESPAQARSTAAYLTQLLTWVAAVLGPLRRRQQQRGSLAENTNLRQLNMVLHQSNQQGDIVKSCRVVSEWIREETKSLSVVIGMNRGWQGNCQIVTHSESQKLDKRSRCLGMLRELLEETIIVAQNTELDESVLHTSTAIALKRITGLEVIARYPLRNANGEVFGAVLCMRDTEHSDSLADQIPLPVETQNLIGQNLWLLKASEPHSLVRTLGLHRIGKRWYRHPFVWSTCIALLLLMLLPMPLKVKCDCQVQPRHRRYVCVPYEGRLEQALTEPGEIVKKGELLARMDGRDIRFEIAGLTAELQRTEKDADAALAAFDTAASQIAGLEAKRLQLQIDVLQQRLENLEIRSPVDGIVMGGDPRKLEGARLSMGETLIEVAPVDEMVVELSISDDDISHVEKGQEVSYRLSAHPWRTLEGPISLIHPRSETRDNKNVFIAEVALKNDGQEIRPGMYGRAKIRADYHPLGWNLFHKSWEHLVTWLAW